MLSLFGVVVAMRRITYEKAGPAGQATFEAGVAGVEARAFRGCGVFTSGARRTMPLGPFLCPCRVARRVANAARVPVCRALRGLGRCVGPFRGGFGARGLGGCVCLCRRARSFLRVRRSRFGADAHAVDAGGGVLRHDAAADRSRGVGSAHVRPSHLRRGVGQARAHLVGRGARGVLPGSCR